MFVLSLLLPAIKLFFAAPVFSRKVIDSHKKKIIMCHLNTGGPYIIVKTALALVLAALTATAPHHFGIDPATVIIGRWQCPDPQGTYLLYTQYIFHDNGEAVYSEFYVGDRELNRETRRYRIDGNVLVIEMKKLIGRGHEYYRYTIVELTSETMVLRLRSRHHRAEAERCQKIRGRSKN